MEVEELQLEGTYFSGLFCYGCMLMLLLVLWNYLFHLYRSKMDITGDIIFRHIFQNFHAPLYGYIQAPQMRGYLYTIISGGIFTAYLLTARDYAIKRENTLISAAFLLLFSVSMALTDNVSRLTDWVGHYGYFAQGFSLFSGTSDLLQNYTLRMNEMGVHNSHYPPGILLTLGFEETLKLKGLTRLLVFFSAIAALYFVSKIGKIMGFSESCNQLAGFLFILSPGLLTYITADPMAIIIFPSSLSVYLFLQGLITGAPVYAAGMGLVFSVFTFFSFSSGFVALLMGILFLLSWRYGLVRFSTGLIQIGLSMAVFAATLVLLYFATNFDLLACMRESIHLSVKMNAPGGFDNSLRYLFRATGAILVYLTVVGFPQSFLTIRASVAAIQEKNLGNWQSLLAIGVCVCLLVSGFSGLFFLETERIWLFFTPMIAIAAAGEAERIYRRRGFGAVAAMLICCQLLAIVYELYLRSFTWR